MQYPSPRYAWYVIVVLTLVYIFAYLDRQILNLLVGPVRKDLEISDTQISLLIGIAFAAFYVTFGLPMGRIADSYSRRGLIAVGFFLWSIFAAGCGVAQSFNQLAIMRMGVGVGEGSLAPAAYSLIADYFPPNRRGLAMGVYNMGITLGNGIALIAGGLVSGWTAGHADYTLPIVGTVRSWQIVFFAIGGTGLLFLPLIATVKEPARQEANRGKKAVPLSELFGYLRANWRAYLSHNLGMTLVFTCAYATISWVPTFFIRHHHWQASNTGVRLGTISAIFGSIGIFGIGWFAQRLFLKGKKDACFFTAALVPLLWWPAIAAMILAPSATVAAILFAPSALLATSPNGVAGTALLLMTPQRMRGQASAIYIFLVSLIGLGLGPTSVAFCTDRIFHDDAMVGYSILLVASIALPVAAVLLWSGRKHYIQCQEAAENW